MSNGLSFRRKLAAVGGAAALVATGFVVAAQPASAHDQTNCYHYDSTSGTGQSWALSVYVRGVSIYGSHFHYYDHYASGASGLYFTHTRLKHCG